MRIGYPKEKLAAFFIKNKEKIFSIIVIMLSLIIVVVIYNNQAKKLKLLNIRRNAEIKKNTVLNDIKQSEKRMEFYKNLSKDRDPNSITDTIRNIAKETNVKIVYIEMGVEDKQPLYIIYPLVLTIGADSYHALGKFINKIENYSYTYSVEAVSIVNQAAIDKEQIQPQRPAGKLTTRLTLMVIIFTG